MNQEKIGKFIADARKKKNLTQQDLAEKLGVSDRTVGNWENGRNMPDLSLFKPLCDELDITINEFLSGEKLKKEVYQEKFEENIINTIDYSSKKINISKKTIGIILTVIGIILALTAISLFEPESNWGEIYTVLGGLISLLGIAKLTKKMKYVKRLTICLSYFISFILVLFIIDYISVTVHNQMPRFCTEKNTYNNIYECKNPLYNVYKINKDTSYEYILIDKEKKYTIETVPVVPFNKEEKGIDKIIKYKNKYVGNNSNDGNLIAHLPLSEYGYVFQIDYKNLGLTINYNITDWYINENYYLEKSLVYNSVSMFALIDNVQTLTFNFSGRSYTTTRKLIEENYPNYKDIVKDGINKENFNIYLEDKLNDIEFIDSIFNKIFN